MLSRDKQVVMVSGGFDPLHDGHVSMLEAVAEIGEVVVALNSDEWLIRKKGHYFMPWEARKKVLMAIRYVHDVLSFDDDDGTVCKALEAIRPDVFANGGDRTISNIEEDRICRKYGIIQVFTVGGDKVRSSSDLK